MSYYRRGDFLSDLGSGIQKVAGFASFIPGIGSAVSGVGSLIGGGISALGSLFGGSKPSPVPFEQQFGMSIDAFTNLNNQIMEQAKKFRAPMTSPGPPTELPISVPVTAPPVEFYASTPDQDEFYDEEDYG